jgi:hypothetical protein
MHSYTAYGLKIQSELVLPELLASDNSAADVIIRFGKLNDSPLDTDSSAHCFQSTAEGMYLFWEGIGTSLIREGKEIIIDSVSNAEEGRLRLLTLGAAIAVILHQRGFLVLHASAVVLAGSAVAFLGYKGAGKSTMAATLHARGHGLLADDVVALDLRNAECPLVLPAFPQLKLWPDAVASLGASPETLPRLVAHLEKRDSRLAHGFISETFPLRCIFLLRKGKTLEIQPLPPQEVIAGLIRNVYVTRFGEELLKNDRTTHFLQLTQLAKRIPVSCLMRPPELSLLPAIAELVEEHFPGVSPPSAHFSRLRQR